MPPEYSPNPAAPDEPWYSFLQDLDDRLTEETILHCMGGFAVVQAYGLARSTADIDVIAVHPYGTASRGGGRLRGGLGGGRRGPMGGFYGRVGTGDQGGCGRGWD
jgi:hypothetical protein